MRRFLPVILAGSFAAPPAAACDVPVFRYALERWRAEDYQLVVFRREPLGDREREALRPIDRGATAPANCRVVEVDLGAPLDDGLKELWAAQSSPMPPLAVLRPSSPGAAAVTIWSGPLTSDAIRSLLDSPARREIAGRITEGQSCVWLFLESGDRAADDSMAARVESQLRKLEKQLKISRPGGVEAAPEGGAVAGAPAERAPPLQIRFSVLRLARSDPAESVLVNSFLLKRKDLQKPAAPARPVVFPIFGRGRVLCAIEGDEIEEDMQDAAAFITGPCSCELKEMNPGMDLLMAMDWDRALKGEQLTAPQLVGVPGLLEKAKAARAESESIDSTPAAPAGEEPAACPFQSPLFRSLAGVSIAAVLLLGLATALYLRRGRRPGA